MTDAPERIWLGEKGFWGFPKEGATEYIRTDLVPYDIPDTPEHLAHVAEIGNPLGAVAMREMAAWTAAGVSNSNDEAMSIEHAVMALPLPDHAALLRAALDMPEVRALVDAFRIAGLIALADFAMHPFILNDHEKTKVAKIKAALADLDPKPCP